VVTVNNKYTLKKLNKYINLTVYTVYLHASHMTHYQLP